MCQSCRTVIAVVLVSAEGSRSQTLFRIASLAQTYNLDVIVIQSGSVNTDVLGTIETHRLLAPRTFSPFFFCVLGSYLLSAYRTNSSLVLFGQSKTPIHYSISPAKAIARSEAVNIPTSSSFSMTTRRLTFISDIIWAASFKRKLGLIVMRGLLA